MAYIGKRPNVNSLKFNGSSTPPTPASEGMVYYDDGLGSNAEGLYVYDGTNWVVVGSGLGLINYMGTDSDAEIGIGNWIDYADAAGTEPVDGTGGSPTIALTASSSSPLRGLQSYLSTKDAANRQGEGHSCPFTIDTHDQAQMLTISFDYDASDANYVDGDMRIFVYDITNSKLIRVNGEELKGGKGTHIAQFQTAPDSVSYRLIMHQATTNANAVTVKIDNIQVGPRSVVKGAAMTDIVAWTPTGSFTSNATYTGSYRRVGDHLEGYVEIIFSGAPNATTLSIDLPNGLEIDQDKVEVDSDNRSFGTGSFQDGSVAANRYPLYVSTVNTSNLGKVNVWWSSSASNQQQLSNTAPVTIANTDELYVSFRVPIKGWSSNAILSEDISGREVAARVYLNGAASHTSSGLWQKVPLDAVDRDTLGMFDTSTSVITIPETGWYVISGNSIFNSNSVGGRGSRLVKNGDLSDAARIDWTFDQASSAGTQSIEANSVEYFEKGDTLELYSYQNSGGSLAYLVGHRGWTSLNVIKIANPQTILDTETVAARYNSDNTQQITAGGVVVKYEVLEYDTHNAYDISTGKYTAPVSGKYHISATAHATTSTANRLYTFRKNGTTLFAMHYVDTTSQNEDSSVALSTDIDLNKGDYIEVLFDTSTTTNLSAANYQNTFSIHKIK